VVMPTSDGRLTPTELRVIAALVDSQAKTRRQLTSLAVNAAVRPLRGYTRWWESEGTDEYLAAVRRVVRPAQLQMARTTDAYLARVMSTMTGARVNPVGAVSVTGLRRAIPADIAQRIADALPGTYDFAPNQPAATTSSTSGTQPVSTVQSATTTAASTVDPDAPYGRIIDSARFQITALGYTQQRVQARAMRRAAAVAQTDIMLADRAQSRHTLRTRGVQRYRRVIRPYAGSAGPVCGLCIVAADRTYFIEDLLPIHANCRCEVVPMGSVADPGFSLNRDDLNAIYAAAGSTGGGKLQGGALKSVRVQVSEHGELGPVLLNAAHRRRGIAEVAAATSSDRQTVAKAQLASYETVGLPSLLAREAAGEDVTDALSWQHHKIQSLRRELGLPAAD
jgi:hypothetical protein